MNHIEIKAPAKINIGLNITSRRTDGYHNLETIFYPINDLFDVIKISKSKTSSFRCNVKEIDVDMNNLIIAAKTKLEKYSGKKLHTDIYCEKNIPIGAGLGGGSSDAAATLISLNEMFELGIKYDDMVKIALDLGSDVPFFLKAKPAYASGRGEELELLDFSIELPIILINPNIHISTKEAFSSITPLKSKHKLNNVIIDSKIDFEYLKKHIKNDFELSIFNKYPLLREIKDKLHHLGAKFTIMSGSGSTIYAIFSNINQARMVYNSFPNTYFRFLSLPSS
ncbi:MAG: 4-(cytidine 5'-diphospho)-2-C-methyl-D-erythritol kinase [bacterium]